MLQRLFSATSIPVLEQVVNFSQARHQVLAGNVANLDTPGYKTRDLPPEVFEARLRQALAERQHSRYSVAGAHEVASDPLASVSHDLDGMLRHDRSNVGIEQQIAALAKNHMQHNLALSILGSQFRLLQSAVSERV